jgi:hypothetical protein
MDKSLALRFYNHFIHTHLSYGVNIYFPSSPLKLLKPILMAQKKALKYALWVPRRTSTPQVVNETQTLLLPALATYTNCILGFRILHNLCPSYITDMFKAPLTNATVNTRTTFKICSAYYRNFLQTHTASSFNTLPKEIRKCKSLYTFKRQVKKHLISHDIATYY